MYILFSTSRRAYFQTISGPDPGESRSHQHSRLCVRRPLLMCRYLLILKRVYNHERIRLSSPNECHTLYTTGGGGNDSVVYPANNVPFNDVTSPANDPTCRAKTIIISSKTIVLTLSASAVRLRTKSIFVCVCVCVTQVRLVIKIVYFQQLKCVQNVIADN